jgi:hypothetical protein
MYFSRYDVILEYEYFIKKIGVVPLPSVWFHLVVVLEIRCLTRSANTP